MDSLKKCLSIRNIYFQNFLICKIINIHKKISFTNKIIIKIDSIKMSRCNIFSFNLIKWSYSINFLNKMIIFRTFLNGIFIKLSKIE